VTKGSLARAAAPTARTSPLSRKLKLVRHLAASSFHSSTHQPQTFLGPSDKATADLIDKDENDRKKRVYLTSLSTSTLKPTVGASETALVLDGWLNCCGLRCKEAFRLILALHCGLCCAGYSILDGLRSVEIILYCALDTTGVCSGSVLLTTNSPIFYFTHTDDIISPAHRPTKSGKSMVVKIIHQTLSSEKNYPSIE
jgi:hypothetical protein